MQTQQRARSAQTHSVFSTQSVRSQSDIRIGMVRNRPLSARSRLLVSSGVAALLFAAVATQPAFASCSVSIGGVIACGTTVTTATTNTNGGSPTSVDAVQLFNDDVSITASVSAGATVSGNGLTLQESSPTVQGISLVNNAGSLISASGNALTLTGNGGNIDYSGSGAVSSSVHAGITASNASDGRISIITTGTITAGDDAAGDNWGIYTSATDGLTTIDLTGGTLKGSVAGGMADSAGVYSQSVGGGLTITANNIAAGTVGGSPDSVGTGIDAAITGSGGAGAISITELGTVHAVSKGISAVNNNLGGVTVNLNSGATLLASGVSTYGEYVRVTGAGGGITITNATGSLIDPAYGVDAQITDNSDTNNVIVHQNGGIVATVTGIIAATNGTGDVLVDGSGSVVGGSGAVSYNLAAAPITANNFGIAAANIGTAGSVTVSGSGTTSGTVGIAAIITNSGNASNVLVDRSGAISVTGASGVGLEAITNGTGDVTVRNSGAIAASGVGASVQKGIDAESAGGSVLVQNVSSITTTVAGGNAIYGSTIGTGTVTIDGTGTISAADNGILGSTVNGDILVTHTGAISASATGIAAISSAGSIVVTPGSTISGVNYGVLATTASNGQVTVTTALGAGGNISSSGGDGVYTSAQNGATAITNNAVQISGATWASQSISSGTGAISITGSGNYVGGTGGGIQAINTGLGVGAGSDEILIAGTGNTSAVGGAAVDAEIQNASNHSNIDIIRSGTFTSTNASGIYARTTGDGNVTVENVGTVTGGNGSGSRGITAISAGGVILVLPASTVTAGNGIDAETTGSGTVTVTTAYGAAGNVTGQAGYGVYTSAVNGNIAITNNASTVSGTTWGAYATTSGTGGITIGGVGTSGAGNYAGGTSGGIGAVETGNGTGVGTNGILISGTGTTTATTGVGISASMTAPGNHSNILINRTGAVSVGTGGGDGIYAVTAGDGNVTVTGVQGVTAGTGSGAIGIDAESHGGAVLVTPAGVVTGGNGINASSTGAGTVTVTTIAGASGNVTGGAGYGINTSAANGDTNVNMNAATISGTTWGVDSASGGTGKITIQGPANVVGGTGGGIGAHTTGAGSGSGTNGIWIYGTGDTSATTGVGIEATMSSAANHSNILIERSGNVSVATGGGNGITATTAGDGNVTVHDVGNVTAGTGSGAIGIDAESGGGAVLVDLTTPVNATSLVSGGNGIKATTLGSGTVTVTTYTGANGNVTGGAGYGVFTSAVDGATVITNNAVQISGTTYASTSTSTGFGTITVQGAGNYVGGSNGGINAVATGAGPGVGHTAIWITGSGNTSSTGTATGIFAQINKTGGGNDSNILIDRSGTVSAGGRGIDAETNGLGNITVTGVGNVTGGSNYWGIYTLASGGNISVTPVGTVNAGGGISAQTIGAGTITVTTASGAAGNVTATNAADSGIQTTAVNGDTTVTNNAVSVTSPYWADYSVSSGTGKLIITGSGNYAGGTEGGIYASLTGAGPAAGQNGILISGSGNTSATTGVGIQAQIASGASNILIDRTGTVSVAAGGLDGIDAFNSGSGSVTVTGTGAVTAGTGVTRIGIKATANGGTVTVSPVSSVIGGGYGIWATTVGSGAVNVTTLGNITGTANDGIHATSVNGAINITTAAGTAVKSNGTGDGIDAEATGTGAITILANSTVSGDPGIYTVAANGPITITANDTVTGLLDGIYAHITGVLSTGDILINGTGSVIGGTNGIEALTAGAGNVTVDGSGNTTASAGDGIIATSVTGAVNVTRTGWVSASNNGINATSTGGGAVTVSGVGNVTAGGTGYTGIIAAATGGNGSVSVTPAGTVSGGTGINASAVGTGTVTVTTASGAAGNVTGTVADGIDASAVDGNVTVTNAAALVSGAANGVFAQTSSLGAVTVDGSGTYSGGTGYGIEALESGTGPGAGSNGILITGSGNTSSTSVHGIYADISNASNASNILINRTGTVSGGERGITAYTAGTGNITVTGTGNVTGESTSWYGIRADASGGNISITPAGTVTAGGGIGAFAIGSGTITVTTATGAAGNVTGLAFEGIYTDAVDGDTVITNNAATVSSPTSAVRAYSRGTGKITVTGPGTYAGGTDYGIYAYAYGAGPAAGQNGILISGAGNTSATTGTGIWAKIDNTSNASNISITRSGTVSVAAGGLDGIDAVTTGTGNIVITGVGNVTAGTGATIVGINAVAAGGNVTIAPAGTVTAGGNGISATTVGSGTISVTAIKSVTPTALNGIVTSAVNGATSVIVNGGTTSASVSGYAAVNEAATGSGNLGLTVASGATVTGGTTAMGVKMVQSGTGNNAITNTGTITGAGTAANPVIYISATVTKTNTITNNAGGVIQSANATANNKPADLAIYSPVTTGAFVITNAGTLNGEIYLSNQVNSVTNSGTWNLRDNSTTGFVGAAFGSSGSNVLTNSGTINAGNSTAATTTTFSGINTVTNSGTVNAGLFSSSDVTTFTASGGAQTVTNTGTFNVHGLLVFAGSSTFNNAGGILDMRTSGSATTDLVTLNTTVTGGGATHLSNTYVPGAAYNFAGGTNSRLGLDTYIGEVGSTGANVPSDRLLISGSVTGTTGILINDTKTASGAYNPTGITLVAVNGTSSNAFTLTGVTSSSAVLQSGRGPMGVIKKGFWFYPLLQSTHAEAAADGLTGANSTEYRLYGLPDVEAFELGLATTGAENVWYETTQAITERQQEVRDDWALGRTTFKPSVWLKLTGSWTSRDMPLHMLTPYVAAASVLPGLDTSFDQNTFAAQIGIDNAYSKVLDDNDQIVVGAGVGYVDSSLEFKSSRNSFHYTGAVLHGSVDYYNGPFFVDVLLKGDLLTLDYNFGTLSSFAYTGEDQGVNSWGILANGGFHIPFGDNLKAYFEPMLTVAYQESDLENFSALGTTADFTDGDTFRGAIGARLGGVLNEDENSFLTGSLTGRYWYEFNNHSKLLLMSAGPTIPIDDMSRDKGFGEITGRLSLTGANWNGWSGYISSGAKFNDQITTVEVNGGVRYQW